jgi:hypothetical protein
MDGRLSEIKWFVVGLVQRPIFSEGRRKIWNNQKFYHTDLDHCGYINLAYVSRELFAFCLSRLSPRQL